MKKVANFLAALAFVGLSGSANAQITREQADTLILQRTSTDPRPHTVYAKDNLQADTANISTFMGELLELDYPCWIYYIRYSDQADEVPAKRRYFVVKESSGSVLIVNTHNNVSPPDLETWRIVIEIPCDTIDTLVCIAKGVLYGNGQESPIKQNWVITTQSQWDSLVNAMNSISNVSDSFAETTIDFSKYQVIAVFDAIPGNGSWSLDITSVTECVVAYTNLETGGFGGIVTQPFHIVKIPISNKKIVFQYEKMYDFHYLTDWRKQYYKIRKDKVILKARTETEAKTLAEQPLFIEAHNIGNLVLATIDPLQIKLSDLLQRLDVVTATYGLEDGIYLLYPTDEIFVKCKNGQSIEKVLDNAGLTQQIVAMELFNENHEIYLIRLNVNLSEILPICRNLYETGMCEFAEPNCMEQTPFPTPTKFNYNFKTK